MATQPTKWYIQIGVNSEKANIPINAGADQIDLSKLYPSAYELPLDAGGNAVGRTEMNALFSMLAENIYFQQQGGVYSYDSTIDYTVGALVLYSSNLYKCIQAHSHTTPRAPTNTSYWQKIVIQSDIANFVTLNTVQTISALKDFSVLPTTAVAPTDAAHLTNKWYVDTTKVSLSSDQTVAGIKTFSSSPLMPTATAGDSSTKGANTAFVQNAIAQLVPTGTILAFGGVTAPSGFLICNGSAVSRTTYANLFAVIGTRYGSGNGWTTFNLPKLNDGSFVRGVAPSAVGTKYNASLPPLTANSAGVHTHTRGTMNITASASEFYCNGDHINTNGAMYQTSSTYDDLMGGTDQWKQYRVGLGFDASRSWSGATSSNGAHTHTVTNSAGVAMNGNTVLPQSVGCNYIIKI